VKEEDEDVKMGEPANVEYVSEQLDLKGPALEAFSDVFARFQLPSDESVVRLKAFCILNPRSWSL
jgi:splicing factor 3B subunit 2